MLLIKSYIIIQKDTESELAEAINKALRDGYQILPQEYHYIRRKDTMQLFDFNQIMYKPKVEEMETL